MTEAEALKHLIPPGQRRSGKRHGGILQIWVTRACDKKCANCTQGAQLHGRTPHITVEQFEHAVSTLSDYFGVVGVFGGNPALHPSFARLCEIMRRHLPDWQRAIWTNKAFGHGPLMRRTFNASYSNVNVHLDKDAAAEFRRDWPEVRIYGEHQESRHSPPWVAMKDLIAEESRRWELIADCDINKYWSAMIGVFRGELRGWFCEIAGAQSILHQHDPEYPDTGVPIKPGWWKRPMADFAEQARVHCHACGIPLRGYGALAQNPSEMEQVTQTHLPIYRTAHPERQVQVVTDLSELQSKHLKITDYLGGASR